MILECPACGTKYLINENALGREGRDVRCAKCAHSWYQARPQPEPPPAPPPPAPEPPQELVAGPPIGFEEALSTPEPEPVPAPEEARTGPQTDIDIDLSIFESHEERPRPIPDGSGLPVPYTGRKAPLWMKLTCVTSLAACTILGMLVFRTELNERFPFLKPFYDWAGFYTTQAVGLSSVNFKPADDGKGFTFDCAVTNISDQERRMPVLRISMRDSSKNIIGSIMKDIPLEGNTLPPLKSALCGSQSFNFSAKKAAYLAIEVGSPLDLSKRQ